MCVCTLYVSEVYEREREREREEMHTFKWVTWEREREEMLTSVWSILKNSCSANEYFYMFFLFFSLPPHSPPPTPSMGTMSMFTFFFFFLVVIVVSLTKVFQIYYYSSSKLSLLCMLMIWNCSMFCLSLVWRVSIRQGPASKSLGHHWNITNCESENRAGTVCSASHLLFICACFKVCVLHLAVPKHVHVIKDCCVWILCVV